MNRVRYIDLLKLFTLKKFKFFLNLIKIKELIREVDDTKIGK